ncbi:MAG: TraV family lipoprotein [Oligoflexia bacterium]|nr:TraV family lipoprotein [Oligoflexia bacterium]
MHNIYYRIHAITLVFLLIIPCLLFNSCSTLKQTTSLGAIIGGITGALMAPGFVKKDKEKALIIGSLAGLLIGGISGKLIHDQVETREKELKKKILFNLENQDVLTPFNKFDGQKQGVPQVLTPKVERVWVEPKVEGSKFIQGHYVYVIVDEAHWNTNTAIAADKAKENTVDAKENKEKSKGNNNNKETIENENKE